MEQSKLNDILNKHAKWLNNEPDGIRADLRSANLIGADLSYADLRLANLRSTDLRVANLSHANLRGADLSSANLSGANLCSADLRAAVLRYADLRLANLHSANLSSANLSGANLIMFQFNQDVAYFQFDGMIRIGCEYHSIDEWIENAENIGMKHNYTEVEIGSYLVFIKMCQNLQNNA